MIMTYKNFKGWEHDEKIDERRVYLELRGKHNSIHLDALKTTGGPSDIDDYVLYKHLKTTQSFNHLKDLYKFMSSGRDIRDSRIKNQYSKRVDRKKVLGAYKRVGECRHFLIFGEDVNDVHSKLMNKGSGKSTNLQNTNVADIIKKNDDNIGVDMPFPVCCFTEINNMPLTDCLHPGAISSCTTQYIIEKNPQEYEVYLLSHVSYVDNGRMYFKTAVELKSSNDPETKHHINCLLGVLKKCEAAKSSKSLDINLKNHRGKSKKFNINNFTIIRKKGSTSGQNLGLTWQASHRYDICGHWRCLPSLKNPELDESGKLLPDFARVGKDRQSNPKPGWTWVNPHIRGDKDDLYIRKTRVVA